MSLCIVCAGNCIESIRYPVAEQNISTVIKFNEIEICSGCGLGMATPRPTQKVLDEYYTCGDYWENVVQETRGQIAHEKSQAYWRVKSFSDLLLNRSNITVLDIGAGHGFIGEAFENNKLSRYDRVEPDDKLASSFNQNDYIFDSTCFKSLSQVGEKKYDVIFANHVLEHVASPHGFIQQLMKHLNPNGFVYIEVPFMDWKFKKDVFPHTLFFTKEAMRAMAEKIGVTTIKLEVFGIEQSKYEGMNIWLSRLFALSIRFPTLAKIIDGYIWKYNSVNNQGIWLRWVFKV